METKELVSNKEIVKGLRLKKLRLDGLAPVIMKMLKLDRVNHLYDEVNNLTAPDFAGRVIELLNIRYAFQEEELRKHVPKDEPFILVSNHPYGGIDGLILLSLISKVRPDFRMMANYLLHSIEPLREKLVIVDPFDKPKMQGANTKGIRQALRLLNEGHPVGIFPAGEVSAMKLNKMKISDKHWNPVVGKMIMKAGVKVVPVYFSGRNSFAFNLLGLLHPKLRTAKLPSELFNKKEEKITVRIGKPVSIKTLSEFEDPDELLRFLRAKTYALGSSLDINDHFRFKLSPALREPEEIIAETPVQLIKNEIERIGKKHLLVSHQELKVYISGAKAIPNVLREISRLREITFREAGEGTNRSCDTDEFDLHYKHLFIWDEKSERIAGAYRIGRGDVLFRRYRKKGFYLNELFRITSGFYPVLKSSLELGRSFVVKDYQRKPYSLVLLWKGILEYLNRHEGRYKYLIGPVSISNSFSSLSKDLLVDFVKKNHFDETMAKHVKPRNKFRYLHKGEAKALRDLNNSDLNVLDNLISDIETTHARMPVLLKKYLKQHAKIISFNIDPKFNNALDGFLVMQVDKIPGETLGLIA